MDPKAKQDSALTPRHLRFLHQHASSSKLPSIASTLANLATAAFFFACRSCEYLKVSVRGRTKILTIEDIIFTDANKTVIQHHDVNLTTKATFVSVTFRIQKNQEKETTRSQERTSDPILCPVKSWATIIQQIISHPNTSTRTPVNFFQESKANIQETNYLSQEQLNILLRLTCKLNPPMTFGYKPEQIGTHSIRSGAAMSLFLAKEPPHRIMLIGRWSSDAFLTYLRPQILQWTSGLSSHMIQTNDFYKSTATTTTEIMHPEDPLMRNDRRSIVSSQSKKLNGPPSSLAADPRFHLFY